MQEKALTPIVDRFGWCTWDAFFLTVDPAAVRNSSGARAGGGTPGSSGGGAEATGGGRRWVGMGEGGGRGGGGGVLGGRWARARVETVERVGAGDTWGSSTGGAEVTSGGSRWVGMSACRGGGVWVEPCGDGRAA
ncbi:hypothetical protein SETIT_5G193800v2 [Setaria italica]|uniref:Uncharacterized protein n=1 Tax=Setaria italica TaxID=4555 RepID=A0A368R6F9_SETIT|nr:hypothetical protein SETIT_5G193800v2 [Setaria italica]